MSKNNTSAINTSLIMKQKSVVIAGCCRNIEKFVQTNLNIIEIIGEQFKHFNVVIYENDSTDQTRNLLIKNKKDNYDYIFENNITIPNRTVRIAHCRNTILQHIQHKYLNYDYMLMLDLDDVLASGKLVTTLKSCFLYNTEQWDAMFANCSNKYYDIYALRIKKYLTSCCWNNVNELKQKGVPHKEAYNQCIDKYIIHYPVNSPLIPVVSAFGGAGLYKLSSIENVTYNGYEETHLDKQICEHVPFHTALKLNGRKLYINPSMLIM